MKDFTVYTQVRAEWSTINMLIDMINEMSKADEDDDEFIEQ